MKGTCGVHLAQISISICGTENSCWTGYCFEDRHFDEDCEVEDDEQSGFHPDLIANGAFMAEDTIWDAREYFLYVLFIRMRQVLKEWVDLVRFIESGMQGHSWSRFFYSSKLNGIPASGDNSATLAVIEPTRQLLAKMLEEIAKTNQTWTHFMSETGDFAFFSDTHTDPHVVRKVHQLIDIFNKLSILEKRVQPMAEACERKAQTISLRLTADGQKNSALTVYLISPLATNPLDICRTELTLVLKGIVNCSEEDIQKSIQWPNNIYNGDLAVVLPKLQAGTKADKLAGEIMDQPSVTEGRQNSIVVEFSRPKITSEFQGKDLRSTIIGSFISRLYELNGWNVKRLSYLGDWGKQIALLYVGWTRFGSQEAFDANPVEHLLQVYHQIDDLFQPEQAASRLARDVAAKQGKDGDEAQAQIESRGIFAQRNAAFKQLEEGDKDIRAFQLKVRAVMVQDYTGLYERLGVRFDDYSGESQIHSETMAEIEQMLKEKHISEESSGAWMVDMTKLGAKAGHAIIRDRGGSSTYLLRDLAAAFERFRKYRFHKMIYVVASDNSVQFTQMFKILEALDQDLASKMKHIKFNEVSRISSLLGTGYRSQAVIERCEEAMARLSEVNVEKAALLGNSREMTQKVAVSALLVQELSTRTSAVHSFDTGSMATFKQGSGPDLQYWYAKVVPVLSGHTVTTVLPDEKFDALADEEKENLLRTLAQYPEVVSATSTSLEASGIVAYLDSLTELLSDCLDEEDGEVQITPGFATLLEATRIVLANSMALLGLEPVKGPQGRADTPVSG
ncbi:hypothetical protein ACEQ8H_000129 [Pleosporales sp. CAS-2024a]